MYCNNCGEKLPDGSAFCNSCGAKLNAAPDNENSNKNSDPAPKPNEGIMGKLASGREAKNRKDWRGAERFYGAVLLEDPNHYEALFYDAYAKAMETMSVQEVFKRKAEMNVLHTVLLDLPDHYDPDDAENVEMVAEAFADLKNLIGCSFVFTQTKNGYGMVISSNADQTYEIFVETVRNVKKVMDALSEKADKLPIHRKALEFYSTAKGLSWDYSSKVAIANDIAKWIEEEKQTVETLRRIPIEAYWKEHADEKAALEAEKENALAEIEKLKQEIETLDEYASYKAIESELHGIDEQLSGTGVTGFFKEFGSSAKEKGLKSIRGLKDTFSNKMSDKKALKAKKAETEKSLEEAKSRLDTASESRNATINDLQNRINEIDEEFNKDR
ncbi:MAG: zinc-ribbon domain-containing protein [Ruminococcus sp.]|nr:zinc-ribbon domain-containing protein [Ruminococcus sp.]